ncbi:ArnT family glycosyltransferase [Candidatus Ruminimicrobiellum ovillum]|uniref:ArnT family glycosyltransferase n=1 Tax=Candidatus Ruminimicrobiellum ovillum TaxID=1947927 RepID=UPI00355A3AFC
MKEISLDFIFTKKFLFFLVVVVAFVAFFHRLGEAPLSGDGIGYGQIAKEMTVTGDYLTPYHDGVPIFYTSKPPLLYWMMAFSGKILGFSNFSVKLPVALLSFLSIIFLFMFVTKYYDYITAFFASIILIFTQQYLHHGRSVVTDGPFALFFMLALFCFYIASNDKKSFYYYLMSFFIGLSIMTKQASGLLIYFVILGYLFLSKSRSALKNIHFYLSFLLVPLIVLPWHIEMYKRFGDNFVKEYFYSTINNVQGWGNGWTEDKVNYAMSAKKYNFFYEWYIYLQLLVNNYWPWLPFLIYGIYAKLRKTKDIIVNDKRRDIFVLCWALVPLIIFQTASEKNGNYLNILYPVFAVIAAEVLNSFSQKTVQKIIKILVAVSIFASILFIGFPIVSKGIDAQKLTDPIKLIPVVNTIDKNEKIVIRKEDNFVFSSMFLFYADRGNITLSDEDFETKIQEDQKYYFASYKDSFMRDILKKYENKIKLLAETEKTILFTN